MEIKDRDYLEASGRDCRNLFEPRLEEILALDSVPALRLLPVEGRNGELVAPLVILCSLETDTQFL